MLSLYRYCFRRSELLKGAYCKHERLRPTGTSWPVPRNYTLRKAHLFGSKCSGLLTKLYDSKGPVQTAPMQFDKGLHCLPTALSKGATLVNTPKKLR